MQTREGSLARVHQMVPVQSEMLGECLATVDTGIRARSTVAENVLPQSPLGLKALLALTARVWLGVSVRLVVLKELSQRQEALATLRAQERPLPCVHALVSTHNGEQVECFGTVRAMERPLSCVNELVFLQASTERKALTAQVALMRPLTRMAQQVALDVSLSRVRLVTLRTFKLALHAMALSVDRALQ